MLGDLNDPAPGSNMSFWPIMAAVAGALLSLRALVESSALTRIWSVASAFLFAFFLTPAVAKYWSMGEEMRIATALLIAFMGVNVLAGAATFGQKFKESPTGAIEWLVSLWRGAKP